MSQQKPDITIDFEYLPFPSFLVRISEHGGFGRDGLATWAAASFEHRGKQHVVWLEYEQGGQFPIQFLRERITTTMGMIEEKHLREQLGDDPQPTRKEGDIVPRGALLRQPGSYNDQYWPDLTAIRLLSFQHFCTDSPYEEWGVEVVGGPREGLRFKAYIFKPGLEPT